MKPELAPTDISFGNKFHNKTFKLTNGVYSFNIHRIFSNFACLTQHSGCKSNS